MKVIECRNICKSFDGKVVLDDVSFGVERGGFTSIVGKSGAGKTTLLHIIGKILKPSSGHVISHSEHLTPILVFQEYNKSIFPWLTVFQNIKLILPSALPNQREYVLHYLSLVGLEDASNKYPWQLSGGMQQRVSIARALAFKPDILLMDEPFGSLDSSTRRELEIDLLKLWRAEGLTIILITHDIDEAIFMSDRVLILEDTGHGFMDSIDVGLDYPRDHITTKNSEQFIVLRTQIMNYFKYS